jgi:hypothetical protein
LRIDILLAVAAAVLVLAWIYRRDRRRFAAERAVLFDDARGLLTEAVIERVPGDYPKLTGTYRGYAVALDAVVDHMAVRKLPSLWLRVTLRAEIPFAGACDLMARAHNVEFYSPAGDLACTLPLPAGWPQELTVKSDDPEAMPPEALLRPHAAIFDADPRMKEMLVTPRGVRLVRQAAQASRAEYMVLRQALFGPVTVPRALLVTLLDAAVALAADLAPDFAQPLAPQRKAAE